MRYNHLKKEVKHKGLQAANDFNMRLSRKGHAGCLQVRHELYDIARLLLGIAFYLAQGEGSLCHWRLASLCFLCFNLAMHPDGQLPVWLQFDHVEERLALSVTRNNQDTGGSTTTDARSLSGGERSFTTLCFELAMWEFCETPFRALDEFDVYMDDTYRKIAVDTVMQLCDTQPQRQFIFITPQVSTEYRVCLLARLCDVTQHDSQH